MLKSPPTIHNSRLKFSSHTGQVVEEDLFLPWGMRPINPSKENLIIGSYVSKVLCKHSGTTYSILKDDFCRVPQNG